ncbi:hypothetical protein JCM19294_1120 [Nonlabens tegetincola]|uniref:Uncharacterized protein n=1 Tax=Nonlabens tegetincola TaxID=323273 RepID=A0A090QMP9_9FLAO|nr:hypothetical protein [Nonlabens tegetincola]GAK96811.1 hypothetical protein JCM19294_1120 [Nonlabens tegetincola]
MLKSSEIKTILDKVVNKIPAVAGYSIVYDDNDFAQKRRDFECLDTQVHLVAVLPNSNLSGINKDSSYYSNQLILFIIQPQDGKDVEINNDQIDFAIDQERKITKLFSSWGGTLECPVKGFETLGSSFEPVRDYHTTIGVTATYIFRKNA